MAIVLNGTTGIANDGGYTGDGVVFADTTPANTLVTNTSGNVMIGTTSASAKLSLNTGAAGNLAHFTDGVNTDFYIKTASLVATIGPNAGSTNLAFQTGGVERARIDSSGNLLVGTTTRISNEKMAVKTSGDTWCISAQVTTNGNFGLAAINAAGSSVGGVVVNASTTSFPTSSDYRLKENIQPMQNALARVTALKPCTYKWKVDGSDGEGFIAHELQAVCPDAVTGEKDAVNEDGSIKPQGIDTSFLVATLTAAIQEQQAIITALAARVEALEGTQP